MRLNRCWVWLVGVAGLFAARPGHALPVYARQFGVKCTACHTVPPALNNFGLAFKANFYNWPGKQGPKPKDPTKYFPVSGIAEFSLEKSFTEDHTTADFRELEFFASSGFKLTNRYRGGFFLNAVGVTTDDEEEAGGIENAFVALPFAGKSGEFAVTAGQFMPFMYQWNPLTELTDSAPAALEGPVFTRGRGGIRDEEGAFSFLGATPGVRLDYFDRRGQGTADGTYLTLGIPFRGGLAFNDTSDWGGANGVFLHGFRRWGWNSLGAFAYTQAGQHLEGLVGTYAVRPDLRLMGIGAIGHDREGITRRLAAEAEYLPNPYLGISGRLEVTGGSHDDVAPVFAVTYYPLQQHYVRLTGEVVERKGERGFFLIGRGQF